MTGPIDPARLSCADLVLAKQRGEIDGLIGPDPVEPIYADGTVGMPVASEWERAGISGQPETALVDRLRDGNR